MAETANATDAARPSAGVSIVIPAFNEAPAIAETVTTALRILKSHGVGACEVVVVDDGSDDGTAAIAEGAGARVIRHPHNIGYGRSLKDGITAAAHDTIVITDADGTYPLERIPDLLKEYARGFDMVVGQRTGANFRESALKSPLRKILKCFVEFTAGKSIPDVNSGLRVFSRQTVIGYFRHLCDTFSFTTSMTLAYMMTWRYVSYLEIDYHKRIGTTKVRLFKDSIRTLQYIVQAALYYNPLKIFGLFSFICILIGAVSLVLAYIFQVKSGFMLGVGAWLLSLLIFCLGMIADLLKQIMNRDA
ncbi:MAG: glycosyltransferase family 2 protein [Rhodospirillaceae bacterium]